MSANKSVLNQAEIKAYENLATPVAIFSCTDSKFTMIYITKNASRFFGYKIGQLKEILNHDKKKLIPFQDHALFYQVNSDFIQDKYQERDFSFHIKDKNSDRYRTIKAFARHKKSSGKKRITYIQFFDAEPLKDEKPSFISDFDNVTVTDALDTIQTPIFWKDKERRYLGANKTFYDYFFIEKPTDFIGKRDEDLPWLLNPSMFIVEETKVVKSGISLARTQGQCRRGNEIRDIISNCTPLIKNNKTIGLIGSFTDITELVKTKEKFMEMAMHDVLTGSANRHSLKQVLKIFEQDYIKANKDFAYMYLDLDNFKILNDTYGHDEGDVFLRNMAHALTEKLNSNKFLARIGGDEFVILWQIHDLSEIQEAEKMVRETVESIPVPPLPKKISVSCGTELYSTYKNLKLLEKESDNSMYKHKSERKSKLQ